MPCGMITPVAQLGKSWSNARNACCVHTRPLRKSCPRCSFALVSRENTGLPAAKYSAFSSAIRRNWASRSGLCPPAKTFSILCRASFCSSIQSCTTGGLTGVPMSVTASAICRGERSVHSTSFSSGSPAVRTSSTDFRFCSSSGSDSIFFFDRHPDAAPVPRQDRWATGRVRSAPAFDGPRRTSQHLGDVLDPAVSQARRFQRGKPPPILLRQRLTKRPHPFLDICGSYRF